MPGQEKIRVLIVDDIAETRETVRRLLQFDTTIEVLGGAQSGMEAIAQCEQLKPDVVLMDINMPDMNGIEATEAIRKKTPYSQIIILSVQDDPGYYRKAMLAGARDFISKPPMIDELTAAIHRAGAMAQEEKNKAVQVYTTAAGRTGPLPFSSIPMVLGKIIVIYSPKGGTGCTTIATNLAAALQGDNSNVALVDASLLYGDVPVFLNEQPKNSIIDLSVRADDLDPETVAASLVQPKTVSYKILAPPPSPDLVDRVNGDQLVKLLTLMRQSFQYIIIDTSSYLSDVVQSALSTSDVIILITTPDIASIKNCSQFLNLADMSGIERDRIVFVLNRFDRNMHIDPAKVGNRLNQAVNLTIPMDEAYVIRSINKGVPIFIENRTHPVSMSIQKLASMVKERIIKQDESAFAQAGLK
ncbi:MAG: MinD/ParA family protein [Leptolinea sp.]|jgi:pilus assembly protein CpaE|nr:MinD/ParA family protein [Leptolinea sp.]